MIEEQEAKQMKWLTISLAVPGEEREGGSVGGGT